MLTVFTVLPVFAMLTVLPVIAVFALLTVLPVFAMLPIFYSAVSVARVASVYSVALFFAKLNEP